MAKTTSNDELARHIERLVQEHIAESRRAAQEALDRAFGSATAPKTARLVSKRRAGGRRRPPEEVAEIGERLYGAICAHPGEGMAAFAAEIGTTVSELHRPMTRLKRDGRIRSVGKRHLTRYFPIATSS
ncbi:MAG: winged helix-turn-helix domain-containing protein [Myxococcales bacterium]|nr:winged helix-turn-helix domain-containing protein [Myxococcales bacterium]